MLSAKSKLTYPLYQHHITISYHHIQYTISREDDFRLTSYVNITSLSATITSSIPFQERITYPLYQHHITISYHYAKNTISREEDLPTIPTSHHHQLPLCQIYHFKRGGLTRYTNIISLSATITSNNHFKRG